MKYRLVVMIFIASCTFRDTQAARILALLWYKAESHFPMFEALLKELAARGHDVVVVGHFPQENPVDNYKDISILGSVTSFNNSINISLVEQEDNFLFPRVMMDENVLVCDLVMKHPNIEVLLKMEDKFDLIINEIFCSDCFLGFVHKFKAPHIALMTSVPYPWSNDRIANPDNPAYIPNYFAAYTDSMGFWDRLKNTIQAELVKWAYYYYSELPTHRILSKYFGDELPALSDIAHNVSLILVNSHFSLNWVRPIVPAFVEVGGLHIQNPKKLPQDLQTFLDEAQDGAIYFSFGTMFRIDSLSPEIIQAFIEAFAQLPLRVLWKCNAENMPALPGNVRIQGWTPQRDVLAHPNVRLFITHGGMMGTQESVYFGVPMVGIPLVADQKLNIQNYVSKGVAVMLDYRHITLQDILLALKTVLYDPRYQENIKQLSQTFRDRPQSALQTAIFWTEYVIRHRGAPHLRSAAMDLPWYQYLLLDVILVLLISIILIFTTFFFIIRKLCHCFSMGKSVTSTDIKSRKSKVA